MGAAQLRKLRAAEDAAARGSTLGCRSLPKGKPWLGGKARVQERPCISAVIQKAHISLKKWGLGIPEVLIPTSDGRSSGRDNSSCRADFLLHHVWAESTEIGAGKAEVVMEPGHPPQADVLQQQERESSGFPPTSCSYEQDIDFLHLLQAQHTDCEHGLHLEPLVP